MHGTISALGSLSTLVIQPDSGDEWVIHNIFTSGTVNFVAVNGGNSVVVESSLTSCLTGYFFHASNTQYYKLINQQSSTIYAGYDAIEIK
jgi:hypothetical protein